MPKDAEGREVPLDTEVMYDIDGRKVHIASFAYKCTVFSHWSQWEVSSQDIRGEKGGMLPADSLYLTPPDSWEKLEEDIRRIGTDDCTWFCGYANENPGENACPDSCKFFKGDEIACRKKLADDILSRIRNLRGGDNA